MNPLGFLELYTDFSSTKSPQMMTNISTAEMESLSEGQPNAQPLLQKLETGDHEIVETICREDCFDFLPV